MKMSASTKSGKGASAVPFSYSTGAVQQQQQQQQLNAAMEQLAVSGANGHPKLSDVELPEIIALSPSDHGLPPPPEFMVELPKIVREYPMPGSRETHEMAVVSSTMLVVSQQTNSILVKVQLCPLTARPLTCASFLFGNFWAGLHGLSASQIYKGHVWATLQFKSLLIRINVGADMASSPKVEQVISLPPSVKGPHCVYEYGQDLWTGCKDSGHVLRINHKNSSDCSIYPCSRRPIFIAIHPTSGDVYASLDVSSKIWRLVPSTGDTTEIEICPTKGKTPVGLVQGPDGNVWFTLVGDAAGGTGTFARILSTGEFQWFSLTTSIGARAGLIHLAFNAGHSSLQLQQASPLRSSNGRHSCQTSTSAANHVVQLWLLGSSLVADEGNGIDAIFTVVVDSELGRIIEQHSVALPTQRCGAHRVLPHQSGLFVTQLQVSSLAHVSGAAVLQPNSVPSENTDFYMDFGLGQTRTRFKLSEPVEDNSIRPPVHHFGAPSA